MASIGGSGSSSNNFSLSNGKFSQDIWKPQGNALTNLYNNAQNTWAQTNGLLQSSIPAMFNGQMQSANNLGNAASQLLNGGAYAGINAQGVLNDIKGMAQNPSAMAGTFGNISPLGGGLATNIMALPGQIATSQADVLSRLSPEGNTQNSLLPSRLMDPWLGVGETGNTKKVYQNIMGGEGNTYADAMKKSVMEDAKGLGDQALSQLDQRAAAAGMGGSTRHGIAQANALSDINANAQKDLTRIGYDTFDRDLNNKLSIAQQADTNANNRYMANLDYNKNLIGAGQAQAANNQNYNLGMGGLANTANNQNLNYNLGYGNNVNTNNNNAYGYGSSLYNAGTNYNMAATNANAMLGQGAMNLNSSLAGLMPQFPAGQQMSMNTGMQAYPLQSQMYGAGVNTLMSPMGALSGYADTIGGPITLGKGNYSSMGNGSSKGGGGGVSVMGG